MLAVWSGMNAESYNCRQQQTDRGEKVVGLILEPVDQPKPGSIPSLATVLSSKLKLHENLSAKLNNVNLN